MNPTHLASPRMRALRGRFASWALAFALSGAAVLGSNEARAMSCVDHAYEQMSVELVSVTRDGKEVPAPPELGDLDELLNSGGPKEVLVWPKTTMQPGKFYMLAEPTEPTPAVATLIKAQSARRLMTACRYYVDYTPILPGRYRFSQEHLGGERVSKVIDDPILIVAPGRDQIELRFGLRGSIFHARYRVKCASFSWDKLPKCAVSEPSEIGFAGVEPRIEKPAPTDPPPDVSSQAPPSVPSTLPPPKNPPPVGARGCGGCVVADPSHDDARFVAAITLAFLTVRARRNGRSANRL